MKKFFKLSTIMLTLLLSVFLLVSCTKAKDAVTEEETQPKVEEKIVQETGSKQQGAIPSTNTAVSNLLNSYISDGKYTKLTVLESSNISSLTSGQVISPYHGGASTSTRRTWYDETADVLLMGNYDGTLKGVGETESGINSGYTKEGSNMVHYKSIAESVDASNLFSSKNVDYTVYSTTPKEYFDVLSDLVSKVGSDENTFWAYSNGVYTYHNTGITALVNSDPYNDLTLKMFQYFAAPMLKVNNAVNLAYIEIYESGCYLNSVLSNILVIKLYTKDMVLLSSCYVVPGLTTQDKIAPMQAVINGNTYDMVKNPAADLSGSLTGEYMLTKGVDMAAGDTYQIKINGDIQTSGIGIHGDTFNNASFSDGTFTVQGGATMFIYLKTWNDGGKSVYTEAVSTVSLKPTDAWKADSARFAVFYQRINDADASEWVSMVDSNSDGIYEATLPNTVTGKKIVFVKMNGSTEENNWTNKWNQSVDATIQANGTYFLTTYISDGKNEGLWDDLSTLFFLYVKVDWWYNNSAYFAVEVTDGGETNRINLTHFAGKYYYFKPTNTATSVVFNRMDPSTNGVWNDSNSVVLTGNLGKTYVIWGNKGDEGFETNDYIK